MRKDIHLLFTLGGMAVCGLKDGIDKATGQEYVIIETTPDVIGQVGITMDNPVLWILFQYMQDGYELEVSALFLDDNRQIKKIVKVTEGLKENPHETLERLQDMNI